MKPGVVLRQEVLAVVVPVRFADDGVHVEAFGFVVVEEDSWVVVVLDEDDWGVHPVVEGACVAVLATPGEASLGEVALHLGSSQAGVRAGQARNVGVDQPEQQLLPPGGGRACGRACPTTTSGGR